MGSPHQKMSKSRGWGQDCLVCPVRPKEGAPVTSQPLMGCRWLCTLKAFLSSSRRGHQEPPQSAWICCRRCGALLRDALPKGFLYCLGGEMKIAGVCVCVCVCVCAHVCPGWLLSHLQKMFPTYLQKWTLAGPALGCPGKGPAVAMLEL